ncbi:MAG: HAD family phosphatase [Alphaproteobacteria bacterium]|nr:HAD family phosphatase [Alphaproteobacteria bacterium SS10]
MTKRRYKAAFYDVDGTLIDSEQVGKDAFINVAAGYGKTITSSQFDETTGMSAGDRFKLFFGDGQFDGHQKEFEAQTKAYVAERSNQIEVLPGVPAMFQMINDRHMFQAVVTNAREETSWTKVDRIGELQNGLIFRITAGQMTKKKPHPEGYQNATRKMQGAFGVDPSEIIVFEDSKTGVEAAKRAGLTVVQIISDENERFDKTSDIQPDLVLNGMGRLSELKKLEAFIDAGPILEPVGRPSEPFRPFMLDNLRVLGKAESEAQDRAVALRDAAAAKGEEFDPLDWLKRQREGKAEAPKPS